MTQTLDPERALSLPDSNSSTLFEDFSGREWFFSDLDLWLSQASPSPWLMVAEPGWGKTALARQVVARVPGALLWNGASLAARAPKPWNAGTADHARLVVIDGLDWSAGGQNLGDWLVQQEFACPVLIFARPNRHSARAQADGLRLSHEEATSQHNIADVALYLRRFSLEVAQYALGHSYGNFLLAKLLTQKGAGEVDLTEVLWNITADTIHEAPLEQRTELYKMLCLLAEAGEPLDIEHFVDFLGLAASRAQELLGHLRPLLTSRAKAEIRGVYQLFNPWLARTISTQLLRDMEGTHASVIAFFRETYPSWDEMSDAYGWHHLGHHCDRYARTGKKRDFSILHWLTEGPYVKIKLIKTRALYSTLQDLRRGLEAALEERDLPRIVNYGFLIPRMRREMGASIVHELADKGELEKAALHVNLLVLESSRYVANLLLAWQAAEEGQPEWAERYLNAALHTPMPELEADDLPLVTWICASLIKLMPQKQESILQLLDLEESPQRAARNYLALGLVEALEDDLRLQALHLGRSRTGPLTTPEHERLFHFVEKCLKFPHPPKADGLALLDEEGFVNEVTRLSKEKPESALVDALVHLTERSMMLDPRPEWLGGRLPLVVQMLGQIHSPHEQLRGLVMMTRYLGHLGGSDQTLDLFEKLAFVAQSMDDVPHRCRALADVGVAFHRLGQYLRSNQLISQAASAAFQLDPVNKISVLKFIAGAAGQVGNHARARDLAYNALEIIESGGGDSYFEVHCRGALQQGVLANISDERSFEMLQFYAENCRQPDMDQRLKSLGLAAVAEGAYRMGYPKEARQWLDLAIGIARAAELPYDRSYMLARLGASEHAIGERTRYERLLQESMEALLSDPDPFHRCDGLMNLAEVRHGVRDARAHAVERSVTKELASLEPDSLLHSRTLLRVAGARRRGSFSCDIQDLLDKARGAAAQAKGEERDSGLLQMMRLELALENWDEATILAGQIRSTRRRSTAFADIAESLIVEHPDQAIQRVSQIPLRNERLSAILRCNTKLASELRPSRQKALLRTLGQLTILATEDETVVDVMLGRWVQLTTDPRLLERTSRKMGWLADDPGQVQPLTLRQLSG